MIHLAINAVPTRPGGGLTVLTGLLSAWQRLGSELRITVLATDPRTVEAVRRCPAIECRDVGPLNQTSTRLVWENHFLGRELSRIQADVLLTNNHYLFNIPCRQIVHHHNVWRFVTPDLGFDRPTGMSNRLRDWLAREALRKADANVFVSDFLRRQAEQFVPDRTDRNWVVRNALDDDVIEASAHVTEDHHSRGGRLVTIQSANPHKDNETAIRCLADLVQRDPNVDWHLYIAGSDGRGSWQPLRDLAEQLGISERLTWCGYCNRDELDRLLRNSLCLIATSLLEAGPLPGIEAIARQCVPVAARIPPRVEFVGDAGVFVEPHQHAQFSQAVLDLYHNPRRRDALVAAGLRRIQQFSWSDRARQFCELFDRLIAN